MSEITNEKQINIAVKKLVPELLDGCKKIFCDNGDYKVNFSFDEEWANYNVKTALFVCGNGTFYSVFEGEDCEVPEIDGGTTCFIGVVSGDITTGNEIPKKKTSRWVCVEAVPTITSIATEPKAPPKDVYVEFMALLNKYIEQGGSGGSGGGSGADGFSPTINVTPIANGHRVTITDINGEQSFDVMNGEKGADGYTPQREIDYWTPADKAEITAYIDTQLGEVDKALDEVIALQDYYTGSTFNELHEYAQSVANGGAE